MAYESKAGFLISLEKRMAEEMTANEMNKALRIVADVIEGYELTEHAAEDITKNYLVDSSSDKRPEGCPIVREVE